MYLRDFQEKLRGIPQLLLFCSGIVGKAKADSDGVIDLVHQLIIQLTHAVLQSLFIDRPDLFQQYHGILAETVGFRAKLNMSGQLSLIDLRRDSSGDNGRAVLVADIVLNNKYRTHASLLAANHRAQVSIIDISSFYTVYQDTSLSDGR